MLDVDSLGGGVSSRGAGGAPSYKGDGARTSSFTGGIGSFSQVAMRDG